MIQAVLADTGPLYALADCSDQYHALALKELAAIQEQASEIAVSYSVLCECYTLVLRRLGGTYASAWLTEVMQGAILIAPEPADYLWAAACIDRFRDHPITLFDAVLAALSRRLNMRVWTFDRHFETIKSKTWK
jgi:predicted nucleic acid-binding protein